MDEKKRIIEFDAASEVPVDGQMPIDSASQGTKKITPALLLKDITDLLGNAPLETQAQVLTAAVNEVNAKAAQATHLTQAEWDALPNTKYTDDVAYFITDGESTVGTALWTKVGTAGLNTNAKNCSGAINELKGTLDDKADKVQIAITTSTVNSVSFILKPSSAANALIIASRREGNGNNDGVALIKVYNGTPYATVIGGNITINNLTFNTSTNTVTFTIGTYYNVVCIAS